MSVRVTRISAETEPAELSAAFFRLRFRTLELPPVRDGLVLGKAAVVTAESVIEMLRLVTTQKFVVLPVEDELVGSIILRESLFRRLAPEAWTKFVVSHVKPIMAEQEVLRFDVEVDTVIEGSA